jgi:hypothetical protein
MSNEIAIKEKLSKDFNYTIETGMLKLCEYGTPRLCSQANGQWYCSLDMFVQGQGVAFKVSSDFNEPSMLAAIKVCYERLHKALKDLGMEVV